MSDDIMQELEEQIVKANLEKLKKDKKEKPAKQPEETKTVAAVEPPKNIVVLDMQNTDDRKGVLQLMAEGKTMQSPKGREFVMSFPTKPPYSIVTPPAFTIFVDEIEHITITTYYKDLLHDRTLVRKHIWVQHKGFNSHDLIDEDTFYNLHSNHTNIPVYYSFVDMSRGTSYFGGVDPVIPEVKKIEKEDDRQASIYEEMSGKKKVKSELPESMKELEVTTQETEEVMQPIEATEEVVEVQEEGESDGV